MEKYHLLTVRFVGPTNGYPAKVNIFSEQFGNSITFSFDSTYGRTSDQAEKWLKDHGYNLIGHAEDRRQSIVFISTTFEPLKK